MTGTSDPHTHSSGNAGYERKDINVFKTIVATVVVVIVIVISIIFVDEIFTHTKERMIEQYVLKPESVQLRELRAEETEILTSYEVLDEEEERYRIPISRAMKLMAEEAYRKRTGGN